MMWCEATAEACALYPEEEKAKKKFSPGAPRRNRLGRHLEFSPVRLTVDLGAPEL